MNGIAILLLKILFLYLTIYIINLIMKITIVKGNEFAIVEKRISRKYLSSDKLIALNGESGFESDILKPGIHFKNKLIYRIHKFPLIHINPDEIAYVVSHSGEYSTDKDIIENISSNNFQDTKLFLDNKGHKGIQRNVLTAGTYSINLAQFSIIKESKVISLYPEKFYSIADKIKKCNGFSLTEIGENEIGIVTKMNFNEHTFLTKGSYVINRLFDKVDKYPKDEFIVSWSSLKAEDYSLDALDIITKDGFIVKIEVFLLLQIEDIKLIKNYFSNMSELMNKHLNLFIMGYFNNILQDQTLSNLITNRKTIFKDIEYDFAQKTSKLNLKLKNLFINLSNLDENKNINLYNTLDKK
ncbi:TPA: SPFH domain-containing protein [Clostridioides difficile]|nr:SPFH domain-containing protein [Clostridioides difficile]